MRNLQGLERYERNKEKSVIHIKPDIGIRALGVDMNVPYHTVLL
jgi:hypothetical protein